MSRPLLWKPLACLAVVISAALEFSHLATATAAPSSSRLSTTSARAAPLAFVQPQIFGGRNRRIADIPSLQSLIGDNLGDDDDDEEDPTKSLPSAKDYELFMKRTQRIRKQERRKRFWRTLFPWWSPLSSFLFPKQYSPKLRRSNRLSPSLLLRNPTAFLKVLKYRPNAVRDALVLLNTAAFLYQIVTAVRYLPGFNKVLAASVAGDAVSAAGLQVAGDIPRLTPVDAVLRVLGFVGGGSGIVISSGTRSWGAATIRRAGRQSAASRAMRAGMGRGPIAAHSMGPFFLDFAHQPYPLSFYQKHRYLTSGFLHGSLLHLYMNLRALLTLPSWLENGIGKGVYLSAYLVAIVTGNIAHTFSSLGYLSASSLSIGASGGILGLYGLMLASLMKMGNALAASSVLKQMIWLIGFGFLVPNVSNAGHIGGFIGGWLVGYLFGPGYMNAFSRDKGTGRYYVDRVDEDFRLVMGPGILPDYGRAIFPLKYLYMGIAAVMLSRPEMRMIPWAIWKGMTEPGTMSGIRSLIS
mmetsp:Transcript_18528/g.38956  ORF Transcript_18528/g.38956 Transcript_18528/m.38956 type:complete len:523 (-) Transcript_18528:14-1582(-)